MDRSIDLLSFRLLEQWKNKKILDFSATPLFGDASGRQYFRIDFGKETAILMKVADVIPGEFGRGDSYNDFIEIRALFESSGLNVPKLYSSIPEHKVLLLEDLGDETLFKAIEKEKRSKIRYLRFAIDMLSQMQKALYERNRFDSPADKRIFDTKLFMDEFYHFFEYMIAKRVYDKPFKGVWPKLEKKFKGISHELSVLPYIFSHRDFQSKNIMIKDGKGFLIDFQDALMAPAVYDLVSLLRDSYVVLSDSEVEILLKYYWDTNSVAPDLFSGFDAFERTFYLQTLQRKMKDAGRFIYLNQVKGKEWFIPYVVPTLGYVKSTLIKLEMNNILEILGPFVPELGTGAEK